MLDTTKQQHLHQALRFAFARSEHRAGTVTETWAAERVHGCSFISNQVPWSNFNNLVTALILIFRTHH